MNQNFQTQKKQKNFSQTTIKKIKEAAEGTRCANNPPALAVDALNRVVVKFFAEECSAREFAQYAKHCISKYGYLTLSEIELAFQLTIDGDLEYEYQPKTLNFKYLNHVLSTYAHETYKIKHPDTQVGETKSSLPATTDESAYETLVHTMNGTLSDRMRQGGCVPSKGNIIPGAYCFDKVYNHLLKIKEIDKVPEHKQKDEVIKWLYIRWPNAKQQINYFPETREEGTGLGSRLRRGLGI